MRIINHVASVVGVLLLTLVLVSPTWASNCPPRKALISSGGSERLLTEVHVVAKIQPPTEGEYEALLADVILSFNTLRVPDRIVIYSGYTPALGGCGARFDHVEPGDVLVVNAVTTQRTGHYGGDWLDNYARVEDGVIRGVLRGPAYESMNIGTFRDLARDAFAQPENGTHELLGLNTLPSIVTESEPFELQLIGHHLMDNASAGVNLETNEIRVAGGGRGCFSAGNPPHRPNNSPDIVSVGMDGLPAGTYSVDVNISADCFGVSPSLSDEITIYPAAKTRLYRHESPAPGETVSGVGVIRGWACNAGSSLPINSVTYSIDGEEFRSPLPHGSERSDTGHLCEKEFSIGENPVYSGYGGVFYWGWYDEGPHTFTLYIDGEEVESFEFFVAAPEPSEEFPELSGFRVGASGEYVIENFLGTDETVTIRWSEPDQNFIIVSYD